ncbi:hypothetical protein [Pseudoduganella ginsengisoli]|uniref:Uncharacterized protein n=1 Tax=Pseudoduganella ginsengisoli TaxID=1462440 RepID=A0A6L6Q8I1_9BURK|nr:hypothetical protein [Pseudoduganella ginsengisoli]MTW05925.1 hypothetical protein [Pseudoduganella ginsengisoli]
MAALPVQSGAAVLATCATLAPAAAHNCHEPSAMDSKQDVKFHGKCSTCASCCTAATAPPHAFVMPAPFPRAARTALAPEPAIATVFPAGLERPPRAA